MNATRTFGTGSQTGNFYNQYSVSARARRQRRKGIVQDFTAHEVQHALYLRDRWTPSSRLTLDFGLRWELYPIMGREDWGFEILDLDTLEMVLGGLGGNPERRARGAEGLVRAARRRRLPARRPDRRARRIWADLRRAGHVR